MRAVDALTLAAVALVVLLVSLPRLRDLALRENESDAAWLAGRLAALCVQDETLPLQALLERDPLLDRQVDDAEFLDGGRVLRRHGYLFEVLSVPPVGGPGEQGAGEQGERAEAAGRAVRAWPWEAGRTGRVALVWTPQSGLIGHLNGDGRWSGTRPPPPGAVGGEGWRRVRPR
jgi:hypothetical protein